MEYFYKFLSKHLRVLKIENDMIYLPNWRPVLGECFRRSLHRFWPFLGSLACKVSTV